MVITNMLYLYITTFIQAITIMMDIITNVLTPKDIQNLANLPNS